jgi:bifunctional non-homologous end joining protein LigD
MAGPAFVPPMLATLTDERDLGEGWILERKLDGIRIIAASDGATTTLFTRNEKNATGRWPEIAQAVTDLGREVVLDGEVVAMDGDEPLGFQELQGGTYAALYAFDVLGLDGADLRDRPLHERRAILEDLLQDDHGPLRHTTALTGDAETNYARACESGWEGLIAKVADGPYRAGRSKDWLKLKCLAEQEVVIGGWTDPQGSRTDLGAILVGVYDGDELKYAGKVGTGFNQQTLKELRAQLRERDTSPFSERIKPAVPRSHWAEPALVAQVAFQEWTTAGRLRQPRFLGLRDDKDPKDVVRERPS